ncbi:ABC transporter ATP-binding protein [Helicobacter enhydrae]|uniref:ABC transporter ATP-binding protein n=1 Tax=Helicobacter enhydrae TaxID=222136 RepID=A0A1B1U3Y1_9HELI|nr:ABC-F family ATP-binding cassette domain-containing protein [Helicobacter enhydrae]ANV97432.1 ABC transporter ATP-binding protein [Helicobacter enhydrae]
MALLSLLNASKAFDLKVILSQVDFSIQEQERIAIVGKNGSGKSTLLKIVLGEVELDAGERICTQGLKISYLPQVPRFTPHLSVAEVIEESLSDFKQVHQRLEELTQELQKSPEQQALLREYASLSAYLDRHQAWDLQACVQEVIEHFELEPIKDRLVETLSGGEQKRVALSQILFEQCDILMLDEPTNHLDVEMVEFLEKKLLGLKCTLVLISHDRYFIENLATRVVEVDNGRVLSFDGGYTQYLQKKEEMLRALSREHEVLLKILKSEEEWLRRGVKARLKRNEGRKKRIMEMREKAKTNPSAIAKLKLEIQREQKAFNQEEGKNHKKMLFEAEGIGKKLGNKLLFEDLSFRILQRDKIAIVGKNGSGKSSLIKVLLGEIPVDSGRLKSGELKIGYFDQHRSFLDPEKNLVETFCPNGGDRVDVRGKNMHIFGYLKSFLFLKEYLTQKIKALSGGEKNRVALALLFTKEYDCLVLDEPTNDLDINTINILEEYLMSFDGGVLFVSHDRYFVDKIAQKLFVFEGNGVVLERHESYSEYLEDKQELQEYLKIQTEVSQAPHTPHTPPKLQKKQTKLSYKEQRALEMLPLEIEKLEGVIHSLECALSDPKIYEQRGITTIAKELEECKEVYEQKLEEYFALEQKREELQ